MSAKYGNDCEAQRHRIENQIIDHIDEQVTVINPAPDQPLKVSILELLAYKAVEGYNRALSNIAGIRYA